MKLYHLPYLLVVFLLLCELVFRSVVPASEQPVNTFDPQHQLLKYDRQDPDGLFTMGSLALVKEAWRVNNDGWVSAIDYDANPTRPLVALIGDSYIDALQVGVDGSLANQLRILGEGQFTVYSFSSSGASLSQYLHMFRYVQQAYRPDLVVFSVVRNDVREAFSATLHDGYQLRYCVDGEACIPTGIRPYRPSAWKRYLRNSALVRYLMFNKASEHKNHLASVAPLVEAQQGDVYDLVTRHILGEIREQAGDTHVIFMLDAPRSQAFYAGQEDHHERALPYAPVARYCTWYGFDCLDLSKPLYDSFSRSGQRFEFSDNHHWNRHGNACIARILLDPVRSALGARL